METLIKYRLLITNAILLVCLSGMGAVLLSKKIEPSFLGHTAHSPNVFMKDGKLFETSSSLKYKEDVRYPSEQVLANIAYNLKPAVFKEKNGGGTDYLGFIAEDVATVEPRLVVYDDEGEPDSLHYPNFTALNNAAIQYQRSYIIKLRAALLALCTDNPKSQCDEL